MIENSIVDFFLNHFGVILVLLFIFLIFFSFNRVRIYSKNNSSLKIKSNDYKDAILFTILFPGVGHLDFVSIKRVIFIFCLYIILLLLGQTLFSDNLFWLFFIIYRIILVHDISKIVNEINKGERSIIKQSISQPLVLFFAIFSIIPIFGLKLLPLFDISSNIFEISLQILAILIGFYGIMLFEFYRAILDIRFKYPILKSVLINYRKSIVNENFVLILSIFTLGIISSFIGIVLEANHVEWISPLLFIINCSCIFFLSFMMTLLWRSYNKFIDMIDEHIF